MTTTPRTATSKATPRVIPTKAKVTPKPAVIVGATVVGDGQYEVGTKEMAAGTFKTKGPGAKSPTHSCFWSRTKTPGQADLDIIADGYVPGPGIVTVKAKEFFMTYGDCTWVRTGP